MEVRIKVILNQDEFSDYCKCMYDENGYLPTFDEVGQTYIEQFIADHSDYINEDNIIATLKVKNKEVILKGNE